ncbi:hypothetical protein OAE87_01125 [bacterium]|nr:hypothetical protein [bacterium]
MKPAQHFWIVVISASAIAAAIYLAKFHWALFLFFGLLGVGLSSVYWDKEKEIGKWLIALMPGVLGLFCLNGTPSGVFLALILFLIQWGAIRSVKKD